MSKGKVLKEPKPKGCSKIAHIFHIVFCFFLFLGVTQNVGNRLDWFDALAFIYSILGIGYSSFRIVKIHKFEKQQQFIQQSRELDSKVLSLAKLNKGVLTPATLSIQAIISIEEAKKILESYVERGIAQVDVTEEGVVVYVFPDLKKLD
ncbi:MAG: hypothetical protein N2517_00955 [Ignavibacteria bacterium]|nr:hypothetical protein [Ignavibacteria bacterium]